MRTVPRPFLKWAGGKRQLLRDLRRFAPANFGRYFEPFLGGGALFFDLRPKRGTLSDVNPELVDCYIAVRDHVEDLIRVLSDHQYTPEHYYAVRDTSPERLPLVARAARTIFLNKTGYNGLYRVNRSGHFNVPFGRYKNPRICDAENLRACSAALADVDVLAADFGEAIHHAERGDFVYLDPPYVPVSRTAAFTAYAAQGFGPAEQERLSEIFGQLSERRVAVVLSNSDHPSIRALYASHRIEIVRAVRAINSRADQRGPIREVVVTPRWMRAKSAAARKLVGN